MGASKRDQYSSSQLQLAEVAKSIGHPARVAILQHLSAHTVSTHNYLCKVVKLSLPTVTQHITVLKTAGLVEDNFLQNQHFVYLSPNADKLVGHIPEVLP